MNLRLKSSIPVFELATIASMIAIGWALFHVYGRLDDAQREHLAPRPRPEAAQLRTVEALVELGERYLALANRLTNGLLLMQGSLDDFIRDRTVSIGHYARETGNLQRELAETQKHPEPRSAHRLRGALVDTAALRLETTLVADVDFAAFLTNIVRSVSNYVAVLNVTETQPLTPDVVRRKIGQAADAEKAVVLLCVEARARAERLARILERRSVELATPPVPDGFTAGLAARQHMLEVILRLLAAAFLVQMAVLLVASYRRWVVVPLHQRILEHTTTTEFQRKLDHFSRLATGLAHEIRNPLTAINIRLFTLQKSLSAGSSQRADTVLIRNEIDRLEQILKDFLRLARPSEPKLVPLTASPLLEETKDLLAEQCRSQGVELQLETAVDAPFLGDSAQLKQVLINLVKNASESIDGHGRVMLRAYENRNDAPEERNIVLEVEDTGSGIAPEVQERLFDPFFSTKENGTGLGLPIAAKIVDQHNGRLEFETRAASGTIFRVILPVAIGKKLHA